MFGGLSRAPLKYPSALPSPSRLHNLKRKYATYGICTTSSLENDKLVIECGMCGASRFPGDPIHLPVRDEGATQVISTINTGLGIFEVLAGEEFIKYTITLTTSLLNVFLSLVPGSKQHSLSYFFVRIVSSLLLPRSGQWFSAEADLTKYQQHYL